MPVHVDLWYVRTDAVDAELSAACKALMAADEATRHGRFHFEKHRHEYVVTRALSRAVLATYVGRPARELAFVRTELGRPVLEEGGSLVFNLTNTIELVACAVGRDRRIGVDAEPLDRAEQIFEVAETVFTPLERAGLAALPLPARRRRAVELWTVKEAYIKARGMGMSLPVDRVELLFPGEGAPESTRRSLRFYPPVEDLARWELTTFEIEGHLLSTCVELLDAAPADLAIDVRRADLRALLGRPPR